MKNSFPFEPAGDASPASWVTAGLHGFHESVLSIVPAGYEAYARVYHPAWQMENGTRTPVRWAEVAEVGNWRVHREMQWYGVSNGYPLLYDHFQPEPPEGWLELPAMGTLPLEIAAPLREALAPHTTTKETCWFAVWEGFGNLNPNVRSAPRFEIPERGLYLFRAPLEAFKESFCKPPFHQTANLWWPDDRAWCVATEIDFMTTYIAGASKAIEAVVENSDLEAELVEPSDSVSYDPLNSVSEA